MQCCSSICGMAYRAAVVGGSGYTGAELLRLLAAHPEIEVVHATADSNAGTRSTELYPSLAPAYPVLEYEAFDPAARRRASTSCSSACPHGESPATRARARRPGRRTSSTSPPTSGSRPPPTSSGTADAHGAPSCSAEFAFGLPELFRAEITPATPRRRARLLPDGPALALAPLLAVGFVEPAGIVVDAASGVSGRGPRAHGASLFSDVDENVAAYGLLTHRHTPEIEQRWPRAGADVQVLFTPHLVPMTRGILATCYARPAATGLDQRRLLDAYARRTTPTSRSCRRERGAAGHEGDARLERVPPHRPLRRPHGHGRSRSARSTTW